LRRRANGISELLSSDTSREAPATRLESPGYVREGVGCLAEGGGDGSDELGFLFGEDGAQVEDEVIVRDAGDDTDGGVAAEALLKLRG
jgi:hypothetical protein